MELKIANFAGSLGTGSDLDLQGPARTHGTRAWGTHYFYGPVKLLREELCPLSPLPVELALGTCSTAEMWQKHKL